MRTTSSGLSPLETILARLDGVRKSGKGYMCKCPAHNDKTPSLSIIERIDGSVSITCFAGCEFHAIVSAIGLTSSDLYPHRNKADMSPQQRAEARQWARLAGIDAATGVLALEVEVILIGGRKSIAGTVTFDDLERIVVAVNRILEIKAVLHGR